MANLVWRPLFAKPDDLVILDTDRRLYAGLSHDGGYFHVIQPAQPDVYRRGVPPVGSLVCNCIGAAIHGHCWRQRQAEAFEAGQPLTEPIPWLHDAAPGELVEAFGRR